MKNEMSRPNTGSVTMPAPAGSNGTRLIHRSTVAQFDARAPPTVSATNTATTAMTTRPIGVASGMS